MAWPATLGGLRSDVGRAEHDRRFLRQRSRLAVVPVGEWWRRYTEWTKHLHSQHHYRRCRRTAEDRRQPSPLPRDRILFDYSFFGNVPLTPSGVDVQRLTPGFEKTFFDGMMSFEMKVPMLVTLDSNINADGPPPRRTASSANLALTLKSLLIYRENWVLSGGLTVAVPTADDVRLVTAEGDPLVEIRNDACTWNRSWASCGRPPALLHPGVLQWDVATTITRFWCGVCRTNHSSRPAVCTTPCSSTSIWRGLLAAPIHRSVRPNVGSGGDGGGALESLAGSDQPVVGRDFRIGSYASTIEVWDVTVGAHIAFRDRSG